MDKTELDRLLIVRGDIAIATLQALHNSLAPAHKITSSTYAKLAEVQARDTSGRETMLSVVVQVLQQLQSTLTENMETIDMVLNELNVLTADVAPDKDTAVENVIKAIRESSDTHRNMSDEQIRELCNL